MHKSNVEKKSLEFWFNITRNVPRAVSGRLSGCIIFILLFLFCPFVRIHVRINVIVCHLSMSTILFHFIVFNIITFNAISVVFSLFYFFSTNIWYENFHIYCKKHYFFFIIIISKFLICAVLMPVDCWNGFFSLYTVNVSKNRQKRNFEMEFNDISRKNGKCFFYICIYMKYCYCTRVKLAGHFFFLHMS